MSPRARCKRIAGPQRTRAPKVGEAVSRSPGRAAQRARPASEFMERLLSIFRMHWDHEPRRSGVSAERRRQWFRGLAALCRGAATGRRFLERNVR
jgi:hypothetical protein